MFDITRSHKIRKTKNTIWIFDWFTQIWSIIKSSKGGYMWVSGFKKQRYKTKLGALSWVVAKKKIWQNRK